MENIPSEDFIEQLKANPQVQEWLKQFKYGNKDRFIESYVELKYKFKSKPPNIQVNDSYRSKYIDIAERALDAILCKKIFDLELRWRAKEITIEGVEISYDISMWMKEPVNCPFVPEITGEDIEIMKAFLLLPDFEFYKLDEHDMFWYDELLKEVSSSNGDKQHWFKFYNKHVSNPTPLNLPNLKGEKEEYYMEIHRKFDREENPNKPLAKSTYTYLEMKKRFELKSKLAEAAGLKDFANYLKDKSYHNEGSNPIETDYAWYYLNIHYNDEIPIRANKNWAKALDMAYEQHAARGAVEHLQTVIDAYRIKKENNIVQKDEGYSYKHIANKFRESILHAREKLGEPRNFDY